MSYLQGVCALSLPIRHSAFRILSSLKQMESAEDQRIRWWHVTLDAFRVGPLFDFLTVGQAVVIVIHVPPSGIEGGRLRLRGIGAAN